MVARGDFVCIHSVYRVTGTGTLSNLYANFYARQSQNSGPLKNSRPGTKGIPWTPPLNDPDLCLFLTKTCDDVVREGAVAYWCPLFVTTRQKDVYNLSNCITLTLFLSEKNSSEIRKLNFHSCEKIRFQFRAI